MVAMHAPEAIMANWMGFVLGWSESLNANHPIGKSGVANLITGGVIYIYFIGR